MATTTRPTSSPAARGVAARMGRWSAAHWKTATFGWLAAVALAVALGALVGTTQIDPSTAGPGESGRMDRILADGFRQPASERILVQTRGATPDAAALDGAVRDVSTRVAALPVVASVAAPRTSADGRSALIALGLRGDPDTAAARVGPVLDVVAAAGRAHPDVLLGQFGDASAQRAVEQAYADDLGKAGLLSLPITLAILVLAFGALVAAGIPLLLALTAVAATFGLIALPSSVLPVAQQAPAMVLLVGLAVGVDYAMFYLRRVRQERAAGRSAEAALATAAATAGRSVLVSGLIVIVAMAGMLLTGDATFASLGVATILVVAVAVLGSLTVLPALLSRLGDRVDRVRVPGLGRRGRPDGEGRLWGAVIDRVLRRPGVSALAATAFLLALAAPALRLHLAAQDATSFPRSLPVVQAYERMQAAFPGTAMPAQVVVRAPDVTAPAVRDAIGRLRARIPGGASAEVATSPDRTVASMSVPLADAAALRALRTVAVPQTVGAVPGVVAGVTGTTARWRDSADELRANLPPVVAFVLVLAFALLLVAFRSLVVAAKAIALNLLSVAAAYGVLVLAFQDGLGAHVGLPQTHGIDPVVPLLLFVILFGLSMDYHVLVLGRVRELVDRGASTEEAVSRGIRSTAGAVTSAAAVMVAVFSVFATLSMSFFQEFGVGLAAAILIDATIIRAVLLPATMTLLGRANWYLPRWLRWLPRLEPTPEA